MGVQQTEKKDRNHTGDKKKKYGTSYENFQKEDVQMVYADKNIRQTIPLCKMGCDKVWKCGKGYTVAMHYQYWLCLSDNAAKMFS